MARLVSLIQLWALCTLMVVLPLWFLNGLIWPPLTLDWFFILCAALGSAITGLIWFVIFRRDV